LISGEDNHAVITARERYLHRREAERQRYPTGPTTTAAATTSLAVPQTAETTDHTTKLRTDEEGGGDGEGGEITIHGGGGGGGGGGVDTAAATGGVDGIVESGVDNDHVDGQVLEVQHQEGIAGALDNTDTVSDLMSNNSDGMEMHEQ